MPNLTSSILASFVALRPRISGIDVEFNIARIPVPKINSAARGAIENLTADESTQEWANLFFALTFLSSVDFVSIGLRNTLIQSTGHVEVWAPGVRLWHLHDYRAPPLDSKLPIGPIEAHGAISITAIIDTCGGRPDIRVMEDGRQISSV